MLELRSCAGIVAWPPTCSEDARWGGKMGGKGTEVSSMTFSLIFLKACFEAVITLSDVYILFRCCNVTESDGTCCLFFAALQ